MSVQKALSLVNNWDDRPYSMKLKHVATLLGLALGAALQWTNGQEVLPRAEAPFGGYIARKVQDSIKDFPKEVVAPKGAPNILLILTDDVGFGATSTFGGPIPTPTLDRLAKNGLRYTQFHTTALCSPTARRCSRGAIIIPPPRASSWKAGTVFPGTTRSCRKVAAPSRRC